MAFSFYILDAKWFRGTSLKNSHSCIKNVYFRKRHILLIGGSVQNEFYEILQKISEGSQITRWCEKLIQSKAEVESIRFCNNLYMNKTSVSSRLFFKDIILKFFLILDTELILRGPVTLKPKKNCFE